MKLRNLLFAGIAFVSTLLLSGCYKVVVLQPEGPVAADEKHLFLLALTLMLIIVVPVIILTFVIIRRYRASNTKAKYTPNWAHSFKLEAIWWLIPVVLIGVLAVITWTTTHHLDPYRPLDAKAVGAKGKPITIQVVALRWKWLFIYPKQNIATVNYVQFPVRTPVRFLITSDAPMNSFQIQQLAGQIYAMNGMQTKMHLMADKVGDYRGRSVSFSGNGFAGMRFVARASTEADFKKWVSKVKRSGSRLTMKEYNKLVQPTENDKPHYYARVTPGLFHKVIMKFMQPMPTNATASSKK